jgi:hypothetical protein
MDNSEELKILVCYYQPWELPQEDYFMPIQAGKAVSGFKLNMQGDDTGDNISAKNAGFGEFTAWYWAWKHIKELHPNIKYIGLSHYRRFFLMDQPYSQYRLIYTTMIPEMEENKNLFIESLQRNDIILSKPAFFSCAVKEHYRFWHKESDCLCMKQIVHELCPEYDDSFSYVFDNNYGLSLYCLFVSKYELFNDYFTWLFPLLFEAEKRIDISGYEPYQHRALAFLAERLLNVYVHHHKLKALYEPICFIEKE